MLPPIFTHLSVTPVKRLIPVRDGMHSCDITAKPTGFWIAHTTFWLRSVLQWTPKTRQLNQMHNMEQLHMYDVFVRDDDFTVWGPWCDAKSSKVLWLKTRSECLQFDQKYARNNAVDWNIVAKKYAGLMVLCAADARPTDPLWYQQWELPSMCVWDPTKVRVTLHPWKPGKLRSVVKNMKK